MANIKIQMKPEGVNDYADVLHPETSVDQVIGLKVTKTQRFVIGTSTAGWTTSDCDYLCDGVDDQVEINNAITALPSTGGEIKILDGTYNITAKISINKSNVKLLGSGNSTILNRGYTGNADGVITLESAKRFCEISGFYINGNKALYVSNFNYGIYLNSSSSNIVSGNVFINNSSAIKLSAGVNNIVSNNICTDNSISGIYIGGSRHIIEGNICNDNAKGLIIAGATYCVITGNSCNNSDYGLSIESASVGNTITGNSCFRGTGIAGDYTVSQYTIRISGTSCHYNLVTNNNCMGKDVVSEGGTSNTLVNNKFN